MALYGNDIDDTVTPLEANLGWLVKLKKGDFVGRDALIAQTSRGRAAQARGIHDGRSRISAARIRSDYHDGRASGHGPERDRESRLGIGIGTCYLPTEALRLGRRSKSTYAASAATATDRPYAVLHQGQSQVTGHGALRRGYCT